MKEALKNFLRPRTQIAFMLYGTFCYLAVQGKIPEQAVIAVVATLMGHYFGTAKNGKLPIPPQSENTPLTK